MVKTQNGDALFVVDQRQRVVEWSATAASLLGIPEEQALEGEYVRVFTHTMAGGYPPYEGEYSHAPISQMSRVLADIGGFSGPSAWPPPCRRARGWTTLAWSWSLCSSLS
mgnify:CR=1 FL=1